MVQLVTALGAGDDTRLVLLEHRLVSFDGDRDRLHSQSKLELLHIIFLDIGVRLCGDLSFFFVGFAAIESTMFLGLVRVVLREHERVILRVEEGSVHLTAVATGVGVGAVNELLLR